MKTRINLILILVLPTVFSLEAQQNSYDLFRLAQTNGLSVQNRTITSFADGKLKGIRFSGQEGDGIAWLNGIHFSNGSIELDMHGKDVIQQSFIGIVFHAAARDSFEAVYLRPFNFRATDSVRRMHAIQYIYQPNFPWERLRKESPGIFEKNIEPPPPADEWCHVRIVVQFPDIKVYVNHNSLPCLQVRELSARKDGMIGLWVGNNSDGDFANLTITDQ